MMKSMGITGLSPQELKQVRSQKLQSDLSPTIGRKFLEDIRRDGVQ